MLFGGQFTLALQTLGQTLGHPLHQLLHAHLDLDAGVSLDVVPLILAALDTLAAETQTEPAADILKARPAFALIVGDTMAVLRTATLADRSTNQLMLLIGMMRVLIAAQAAAFIWLQAIAVRRTRLQADGLTEAENNGAIAGTTYLHRIPAYALLIHNVLLAGEAAAGIAGQTCPGQWHLVLDTDVLLAVAVRYGQALRLAEQQQQQREHLVQHL